MRGALVALAVALGAVGCGGSEEDDVRAAYERMADAYRSGDSATWCDSIVPDTLLPDAVLERLPVEGANDGPVSRLDGVRRECRAARPLDDVSARERAQAESESPERVRMLELEPTGGVEAAAILGTSRDGAALVRIDGDWLLVFDSR